MHLDRLLPRPEMPPRELFQAMRYACLSPGKRLRPALVLASCSAAGGDPERALDVACAVEMLHSFSLIHDDLPALDDDELRRGRPTCHVEYGEAVAILAGDALFNQAYLTLAKTDLPAPAVVRLVLDLANATGAEGVVAGETADILAEGKEISSDLLVFIHSRKTAALIAASCAMGAVVATSDERIIQRLRSYGDAVGLAFQIADDLLNETSTPEQLGKSAGSDRARGKATYPALFGVEESYAKARALVTQAVEYLEGLPGETGFLRELAEFTISRGK